MTNEALVQRIDALSATIQQRASLTGRPPDESAMADLRRLRLEALDARGPLELAEVDRALNAWTKRFEN